MVHWLARAVGEDEVVMVPPRGLICFTIVVSLLTRSKPDEELRGLVRSMTEKKEAVGRAGCRKPRLLGVAVLMIVVALDVIFF